MHRILWTRTPEVNQPEVPGPQYRKSLKSLAGDGTRRSSRGRSAKTVFYSGVLARAPSKTVVVIVLPGAVFVVRRNRQYNAAHAQRWNDRWTRRQARRAAY